MRFNEIMHFPLSLCLSGTLYLRKYGQREIYCIHDLKKMVEIINKTVLWKHSELVLSDWSTRISFVDSVTIDVKENEPNTSVPPE